MKEATFWRKHLKPELIRQGWVFERMAYCSTGQTDAFAFKNGVYVGIEIKSLDCKTATSNFDQLQRKQTAAQRRWQQKVIASGGMHLLIGSHKGVPAVIFYQKSTKHMQEKNLFTIKDLRFFISDLQLAVTKPL